MTPPPDAISAQPAGCAGSPAARSLSVLIVAALAIAGLQGCCHSHAGSGEVEPYLRLEWCNPATGAFVGCRGTVPTDWGRQMTAERPLLGEHHVFWHVGDAARMVRSPGLCGMALWSDSRQEVMWVTAEGVLGVRQETGTPRWLWGTAKEKGGTLLSGIGALCEPESALLFCGVDIGHGHSRGFFGLLDLETATVTILDARGGLPSGIACDGRRAWSVVNGRLVEVSLKPLLLKDHGDAPGDSVVAVVNGKPVLADDAGRRLWMGSQRVDYDRGASAAICSSDDAVWVWAEDGDVVRIGEDGHPHEVGREARDASVIGFGGWSGGCWIAHDSGRVEVFGRIRETMHIDIPPLDL